MQCPVGVWCPRTLQPACQGASAASSLSSDAGHLRGAHPPGRHDRATHPWEGSRGRPGLVWEQRAGQAMRAKARCISAPRRLR